MLFVAAVCEAPPPASDRVPRFSFAPPHVEVDRLAKYLTDVSNSACFVDHIVAMGRESAPRAVQDDVEVDRFAKKIVCMNSDGGRGVNSTAAGN